MMARNIVFAVFYGIGAISYLKQLAACRVARASAQWAEASYWQLEIITTSIELAVIVAINIYINQKGN